MSTTRVPPIPITTRPSSAASGYAQGEHPAPAASKPTPPPAPPAPVPHATTSTASPSTKQTLNVAADVSAAHAAILADVENLNTDSKNAIRKLLTDSEKTIGVAIPALKALFGIK